MEEDGVDTAEEVVSAVTTTLDDGESNWREKRSSNINLSKKNLFYTGQRVTIRSMLSPRTCVIVAVFERSGERPATPSPGIVDGKRSKGLGFEKVL